MRAAQAKIASDSPHTVLISNDGLSKIYDKVHYDAKGLVELGLTLSITAKNSCLSINQRDKVNPSGENGLSLQGIPQA